MENNRFGAILARTEARIAQRVLAGNLELPIEQVESCFLCFTERISAACSDRWDYLVADNGVHNLSSPTTDAL